MTGLIWAVALSWDGSIEVHNPVTADLEGGPGEADALQKIVWTPPMTIQVCKCTFIVASGQMFKENAIRNPEKGVIFEIFKSGCVLL